MLLLRGLGKRRVVQRDRVLQRLEKGDYFGEIALVLDTKRTCHVRAQTFCELCTLHRAVFERILRRHEGERDVMKSAILEKYPPKDVERWEETDTKIRHARRDPAEVATHARQVHSDSLERLAHQLAQLEDAAHYASRADLGLEISSFSPVRGAAAAAEAAAGGSGASCRRS